MRWGSTPCSGEGKRAWRTFPATAFAGSANPSDVLPVDGRAAKSNARAASGATTALVRMRRDGGSTAAAPGAGTARGPNAMPGIGGLDQSPCDGHKS
mmetsp:Transcript_32274/g.68703  ORF Transcript_32274/g.68703 Transcript_32274/m.68703 type:complete len:97 (+) Transcript_32274:339-629(+)